VIAWVRTILLALGAHLYPGLVIPNLDQTAAAIDAAAHEIPLDGDPSAMAAELAVLAATEGHFQATATATDRFGQSFGLWQIHETTLTGYLHVDPLVAEDPERAALLAAWLVRKSHEVCAGRPAADRLSWFASGGPTCSVPEGLAASRRRTGFVAWVLKAHPPVWVEIRSVVQFTKNRF
jgi:hypothetical protein